LDADKRGQELLPSYLPGTGCRTLARPEERIPDKHSVALDSPFRASTTSAKRWRLRRGKSSCTPTKTERSAFIRVFPRPKLHFDRMFMNNPG
jgi:hypothetical protein